MIKLISWILEKTKIGKTVKSVQTYLDGKKQLIAGLAVALPASTQLLLDFAAAPEPIAWLGTLSTNPTWLAAGGGWVAVFNAVKGEKIRAENATIISQNEAILDKNKK